MKVSKLSKFFLVLFTFFIFFAITAIVNSSLSDFIPYHKQYDRFQDDNIYAVNRNIDISFNEEELKATCYYHYDYKDNKVTLYTNRNGYKKGALIYTGDSPIGFAIFPFSDLDIEDNIRYDVKKSHLLSNSHIKSSLGNINLTIDYLIIDENANEHYKCEYIIYPSNNNIYIPDYMVASNVQIVRGITIKESFTFYKKIYLNTLLFVTLFPVLVLLFVGLSFYLILLRKERINIIINNVFYRKKIYIFLKLFLTYYFYTFVSILGGCLLSFLIFSNGESFIFISEILSLSIIYFIYLFILCFYTVHIELKGGINRYAY